MVLDMSQWPRYTQKAPNIIKIMSFKGSRGILRGGYIHIHIYIHMYTYMYVYIHTYIYVLKL